MCKMLRKETKESSNMYLMTCCNFRSILRYSNLRGLLHSLIKVKNIRLNFVNLLLVYSYQVATEQSRKDTVGRCINDWDETWNSGFWNTNLFIYYLKFTSRNFKLYKCVLWKLESHDNPYWSSMGKSCVCVYV